MNVLSNFIVRKMNTMIKLGFTLKSDPKTFRDFKQQINNVYGIFFINYIKTKDSNIYTVMTKRNNSSYIYTYNIATNELIFKGERKNVNT